MANASGSRELIVQIETIVQRTIERDALAQKDDRILVALSGGADSTALTLIFQSLGYQIVAGHVDHGMRDGSDRDADHCNRLASRLGIPFESTRVDVEPPTEARAREIRYEALESMATSTGASLIATGHTMDDQAETVVWRLGRGGFPLGIRTRRGRVIRPLLELRRSDTEKVCVDNGVEFLLDPSNDDERYTRNLIRKRVMPRLAGRVPELAEAGRLGEEAAQLIDAEVDRASEDGKLRIDVPEVRVDRNWLVRQSEALRRQVLRRALRAVGAEASSRLVEDVYEKVAIGGKRLSVFADSWAIADDNEIRFEPSHATPPLTLPGVEVRVPGRTDSPEWELTIDADLVEPSELQSFDGRRGGEVLLDADAIGSDLRLRQRRDGDRLHPFGMSGTKKLQDLFVDEKIPRSIRDRVPIFTSNGHIAWVAGVRIDQRFALTSSSSRALRVRVRSVVFPFLQET